MCLLKFVDLKTTLSIMVGVMVIVGGVICITEVDENNQINEQIDQEIDKLEERDLELERKIKANQIEIDKLLISVLEEKFIGSALDENKLEEKICSRCHRKKGTHRPLLIPSCPPGGS